MNRKPIDGSVWAVSDIHLGKEGSNYRDFSELVGWASAQDEFPVGGLKRVIKRPARLVLIGDFLEPQLPGTKRIPQL